MTVVPIVLSPRDLVSRPVNMDETALHTRYALANSADPDQTASLEQSDQHLKYLLLHLLLSW